jgi:hypothetical protein
MSIANPPVYEFSFPQLDTLVQVESAAEAVVIRVTRNTFTEERKTRFIRELVAEGFISDDHYWSADARGVRWLVDFSWLQPDPTTLARTRRFMIQLLSGTVLVWLTMVGLTFLSSSKQLATPPATVVAAAARAGGLGR